MQWFPDMLTVILEKGVLIGIALLILFLLLRWAIKTMTKELEEIHQAVMAIKEIRLAMIDSKDPQGRDIIKWNELRNMIESLHKEIEHKCGSASCPVIPIVQTELNSVHNDIANNLKEATRTKIEMERIIEKIFEAVKEIFTDSKAFHSELGKVMIIAIQRMAEREQKFKGRDS